MIVFIFSLTASSPMAQQISFAPAEYDAKRKQTRRDRFLGEMAIVVPWAAAAGATEST